MLKLASNALKELICISYGAGLLCFYQFCDDQEIPESARLPVSSLLLLVRYFILVS